MLVKLQDNDEAYPVMGIAIDHIDNITYVYFSDFYDAHSQYMKDISSVEVVDNNLPSYWTIGYDKNGDTHYLSFPEWTSDPGEPGRPGFYERYLEGEPEEIQIMSKYYDIELSAAREWVNDHSDRGLKVG